MKEDVEIFIDEGASVLTPDKFGLTVLDMVNGRVDAKYWGLNGELPDVSDEVADMIQNAAEQERLYQLAVEMIQFGVTAAVPLTNLRVLAEEGYVMAQHTYAQILEFPEDGSIAPDIEQALYWYEEAANSGYVESMFRLGSIT